MGQHMRPVEYIRPMNSESHGKSPCGSHSIPAGMSLPHCAAEVLS